MTFWASITPDMMSDEEKRGTKYIRHQPCYQSDRFNAFMQKLDERYEKIANPEDEDSESVLNCYI